jgi:hypothetical protein
MAKAGTAGAPISSQQKGGGGQMWSAGRGAPPAPASPPILLHVFILEDLFSKTFPVRKLLFHADLLLNEKNLYQPDFLSKCAEV